jgi:FixJ family two-component response regulator
MQLLSKAGTTNAPQPLIAIIDDDAGIRFAIEMLMRSANYRVVVFVSAEAFLLSGTVTEPDCIITDIAMPYLDGWGLVKILHQQGCTTPIIMITALPEHGLETEAIKRGVHCLLRKPFDADALLSSVEKSLAL